MKRLAWLFGVLVVVAACSSLPYKDDVGFLVSAQADSPEFPAYINGHLCTDMEGFPGQCMKRIRSDEDVTFSFDAQTYAYQLLVNCSQGMPAIAPATVPAGQKYSFQILHTDFVVPKSFTCIGEISPQDRDASVSAKFEVRFKIIDMKYEARERAYLTKVSGKNVLVLGQHARLAYVFDEGKWTKHHTDTMVQIKGDPDKVKAYSESFAMRFNYFNMGDADGGVSLD